MDHFTYQDGILHAEAVPIPDIAAAISTPFYVYSTATLTRHFHLFQEALAGLDHLICYSVKSNSNLAVLRLLADLGAGMDVVSGGEYARARAAGVPGGRIVFSGVGKTRAEMQAALTGGIRQFNVESEAELALLGEVATALGTVAPVALRINPDVDAGTHDKISTGRSGDKFGIPISRARAVYDAIAAAPGVEAVGIDMHIGSQITALAPFRRAFRAMAGLAETLRADGHAIARLDLGGGLGIPYERGNDGPPLPLEYGRLVREELGHLGCEIEIEPGRLISGNAGLMVAGVTYVKRGEDRQFLILDAAMNDLVRPALYEAHHDIVPVRQPAPGGESIPYDIVGPVCESSDIFARARPMAPLGPGDLVAFRSAGAYGAVMASEYNSRPLVPEVMVDADQYAVIRRRPSYEEMLARDMIPAWLRN